MSINTTTLLLLYIPRHTLHSLNINDQIKVSYSPTTVTATKYELQFPFQKTGILYIEVIFGWHTQHFLLSNYDLVMRKTAFEEIKAHNVIDVKKPILQKCHLIH